MVPISNDHSAEMDPADWNVKRTKSSISDKRIVKQMLAPLYIVELVVGTCPRSQYYQSILFAQLGVAFLLW